MNEIVTIQKTSSKTALKWCWLAYVVIMIDQLTKHLIMDSFSLYEFVRVLPFFNLTLVYNSGAAFSFLSDHPAFALWVLSGFAIFICIMLVFWLRSTPAQNRWMGCALALVLGGGLGNLIDRIFYGHVIDFLDFHYGNAHFPAFNIADTAITIGAVMVFLEIVFKAKEK